VEIYKYDGSQAEYNRIVAEKTAQGFILTDVSNVTEGDFLGFKEPSEIIPPATTLDQKIEQINKKCNEVIEAGFDSTVKYGTSKHYTLRAVADQLNMKTLYDKCTKGATKVPWHYAGQDICEVWTAAEFMQLFEESEAFVTQQRFYSDGLVAMAKAATTPEELQAVQWGIPLDATVQASINAVLAELMGE
jgi:Asp-tRNA(Asn)/Glu-tRNA(Gln) amidotransferase B subunit